MVEKGQLIHPGSEEECEIRGIMIYLISMCSILLKEKFKKNLKDIEIDWILWQYGEFNLIGKHPHHKTLTCFY